MKARVLLALILGFGCAFWIMNDARRRAWINSNAVPVAQRAGDAVQDQWKQLSDRISHLDERSTRHDLEEARRELTHEINLTKKTATSEYVAAKAQLDRINAAERLKDAKEDLAKLEKANKDLTEAVDHASKAWTALQKKEDEAKASYEAAKAHVEALGDSIR